MRRIRPILSNTARSSTTLSSTTLSITNKSITNQWITATAIAAVLAANVAGPLVSSAHAQEAPPEAPAEGEADPDDQQRFRELGQTGAQAFADKDYQAAEEAFKAAYEIKAVANLLYNIGRALEKQGDFEGATAYYEKFVNEPDVELKARQDALQRLKTLREVLALREEGDEVDGQPDDQQQDDQQQVDQEQAEPALADTVNQEDGHQVEHDYTLAYVFGLTGAATLIGSGVFAALTATEQGNFDDAATLAERRSAADTGHTYTTVADSLLVAGTVFTAAGLYFWASAPEQAPSGEARLVPSVGPRGASVTLTLDF